MDLCFLRGRDDFQLAQALMWKFLNGKTGAGGLADKILLEDSVEPEGVAHVTHITGHMRDISKIKPLAL